jgi:hypothetical protein
MTVKYTSIFHCKALQNLPKLGFLGLKTNHLATLGWRWRASVRALSRIPPPTDKKIQFASDLRQINGNVNTLMDSSPLGEHYSNFHSIPFFLD